MSRFTVAATEKTSAQYTATLVDETGTAIPSASLTALTLTLYDSDTDAIINSRNAQSVLNVNGVTVSAAGLLTWTIAPADTTIQTAGSAQERHRALFTASWGAGKQASWEVDLVIQNLAHLT